MSASRVGFVREVRYRALGGVRCRSNDFGETLVTHAAPLPAPVLEALKRYDTPTICNAMEIVAPERRLIGYTTRPLVCPFPDLPPMVGYARTVAVRSVIKSGLSAAEQTARRIGERHAQHRRRRYGCHRRGQKGAAGNTHARSLASLTSA